VPHFTLPVGPQGPVLNAVVAVSNERRAALVAAGQSAPKPVPITALIDTGASSTCVDPSVLNALSLTPTGIVLLNTPSTGETPHQAEQFDISLIISAPLGPALMFRTIPVVASELLASQGFHALVGRDILNQCLFSYNGSIKLFTLAY
jgi:hypothetical protein